MDFERFARRAEEILSEVPEEFLRGVVGVHAHRERRGHSHLDGVVTLGECVDDEVSRLVGLEEIRSRVHLYHGSFLDLARRDPSFDWDAELRETVLHEIRHHIEDRAGIKDLLEEDALDDALARFLAGEELPAGWYCAGEEMEPDVYRVGDDLFLELRLRPAELDALRGGTASMTVLGEPFEPEIPGDAEPGEILTFDGEGLERPGGGHGALHLVLLCRGQA